MKESNENKKQNKQMKDTQKKQTHKWNIKEQKIQTEWTNGRYKNETNKQTNEIRKETDRMDKRKIQKSRKRHTEEQKIQTE